MTNMRLDKYVLLKNPSLSRSKIQKMIKEGEILVNEKKAKCAQIVEEKDKIRIKKTKSDKKTLKEENLKIEVLYEDKNILVINKPAGIVVHPGEGNSHLQGTIVHSILNKISEELKKSKEDNKIQRPGIIHRLDKDTSGALIIAKTEFAFNFFIQQFKERKIKKEYVALVFGKPIHPEGKINSPIGRSLKNRKKMTIEETGKEAVTEYKVEKTMELEEGFFVSLLKIKIPTGRTHQIRVHMSAIGHPVVGDQIYGSQKLNKKFEEKVAIKRQFLHAKKITFILPEKKPTSKTKKTITAPLSKDLQDILRGL
jgi:23S rRNA pseudouridine1911/1915/1917 synthase